MSGRDLPLAVFGVLILAVTAHADPVKVSCDFIEINAAKGAASSIDKALPPKVAKKLKRQPFSSEWQVFTLLSQTTKPLAKGTAETITLKQGSVTATLVEVVDKSKVRLTTNLTSAAGKAVSTMTSTFEAGDYVITVDQLGDNGHLLALTCK